MLLYHLTRGSGVCLLNTIVRSPSLPPEVVRGALKDERVHTLARERAGASRHLVVVPAFRVIGPLWKIIDFDGSTVPESSNRHPYGPQKRKYLPLQDCDSDQSCSDLE